MLPDDTRESWDPELLPDPRVTHLWDPDREIGRWFNDNKQAIGFEFNLGIIVWDAFLLFGPDATWDEVPAPLVSFGYTVIGERELLRATMQQVLAGLDATSQTHRGDVARLTFHSGGRLTFRRAA